MFLRTAISSLSPFLSLLKTQTHAAGYRRRVPRLMLAASLGSMVYFLSPYRVRAIEDQEIQKVKKEMERVRAEVRNKYGDTTDYPVVK